MLLLIFKVGIPLRTPKSVIETHKIQKLDFFKCPPVRPWCSAVYTITTLPETFLTDIAPDILIEM